MISLFDIKRILTPEKSTMPSDDFRIIQSWAEYDETSGKNPENKNLNYLCYELEVMNPDTGERIHLFKAIKFARVIRLPANAKQSTAFMNMQQQILAGVYADDDVRNRLYFGVQCGHPYGSDYMYEIFTGRYGYDIEFKCKNKKEVLQVIDQLAKDFEKEKHTVIKK